MKHTHREIKRSVEEARKERKDQSTNKIEQKDICIFSQARCGPRRTRRAVLFV
jgi:hypothetical protein